MPDGSETCRASASAIGSGNIRPARPRRANPMTASGSRRYLMRAVLCLTVGSTGLFGCGRLARAQTQVGPARSAPDTDVPAAVATPGPISPPSDFDHLVDMAEAEGSTAGPEFLPGTLPPDAGAGAEMGLLGLIGESIFGNRSDLWRPLPLSTFLSEGWFEPWYPCPAAPPAPPDRVGSTRMTACSTASSSSTSYVVDHITALMWRRRLCGRQSLHAGDSRISGMLDAT